MLKKKIQDFPIKKEENSQEEGDAEDTHENTYPSTRYNLRSKAPKPLAKLAVIKREEDEHNSVVSHETLTDEEIDTYFGNADSDEDVDEE